MPTQLSPIIGMDASRPNAESAPTTDVTPSIDMDRLRVAEEIYDSLSRRGYQVVKRRSASETKA